MMNSSSARHMNQTYRPYKGDEMLAVKFYLDDKKNERLTRESGYAVYEDVEMIEINIPGDKQLTVHAPANSPCTMMDGSQVTYIDRFPDDYDRFKKGLGAAVVGLPLKHAPFLSKSEVSMLGNQNVYTVEQLADMGGAPLRNLGPSGRKWQQQALAFLKTAQGSRDAVADAAEKASLLDRIAQLEAAQGLTPPAAQDDDGDDDGDDGFDAMSDADLKSWIKETTGAGVRGNPSRDTLLSIAREASQKAA